MNGMRWLALVALPLLLTPPVGAAVDLVWHAEMLTGGTLESRDADRPVNPASVMKIATTLWALEELGPDHRFVTRFRGGASGIESGVLKGDLWVEGGGDPDFHPENVFMVAAELNRLGVEEVGGSLRVGERFWIGWENGSEKRRTDRAARGGLMAARLRDALDPARWDPGIRRSWTRYAARRGLDPERPFRVSVRGGARWSSMPSPSPILVEAVSKPLHVALRRFNVYSNNDIERIGETLGGAAALEVWLAGRLEATPGQIRVETTSGLGSNRLTPRLVVRLLRELVTACDRLGVRPVDLLPVAGCDPGTLPDSFPAWPGGRMPPRWPARPAPSSGPTVGYPPWPATPSPWKGRPCSSSSRRSPASASSTPGSPRRAGCWG